MTWPFPSHDGESGEEGSEGERSHERGEDVGAASLVISWSPCDGWIRYRVGTSVRGCGRLMIVNGDPEGFAGRMKTCGVGVGGGIADFDLWCFELWSWGAG